VSYKEELNKEISWKQVVMIAIIFSLGAYVASYIGDRKLTSNPSTNQKLVKYTFKINDASYESLYRLDLEEEAKGCIDYFMSHDIGQRIGISNDYPNGFRINIYRAWGEKGVDGADLKIDFANDIGNRRILVVSNCTVKGGKYFVDGVISDTLIKRSNGQFTSISPKT